MPRQITYDWTYSKLDSKKTYIIPAGSYYIGDLFYVIDKSYLYDIFEETGYDTGYYHSKHGLFIVDETGFEFGSYIGTDRKKYSVDNGIIAIMSANLIQDPDTTGGHIYTFENEVAVRMNNGIFRFNSYYNDNTYFDLTITTISKDEEDSE
jgi:hypothetical protein